VHAIEAGRGDHVPEHFHCIVLDHPQIAQAQGFDLVQQAADAGAVNLDAEIVVLRMGGSDGSSGIPMPKPISRIFGALRPKAVSRSSRLSR